MPDVLDLHETLLAELRHSGSELAACIVVTAVADHVVLAGQADSFLDRHTAASLLSTVAGVRDVTDQVEIRLDLDRNSLLLLAARQAMAEVRASHQTRADETRADEKAGSAVTPVMGAVLLTVTGQIDWRQSAPCANPEGSRREGYDAASNIGDDILKMLPHCSFTTSHTYR